MLSLLDALLDDVDQLDLEVLDRHILHKSWDIDVLGLEEVDEIAKAVESAELKGSCQYIQMSETGELFQAYITSTLLIGFKVVDNFGVLEETKNELNYAASSFENLRAGFPTR